MMDISVVYQFLAILALCLAGAFGVFMAEIYLDNKRRKKEK